MRYTIRNAQRGIVVAEYDAEAPMLPHDIDPAYVGAAYETWDADGRKLDVEALDPNKWRVSIGAFFDRFGMLKYAILASQDATVQAIVRDVSVRRYVDLYGRRADIEAGLNVLVAKGFAIDVQAIINTQPAAAELWNFNG